MNNFFKNINQQELLNLLVDKESGAIFKADNINDEIEMLYSSLENIGIHNAKTIEDLLNKVDHKSEITEILGVNEFFENINKSFQQQNNFKFYLPIKDTNNVTRVYSFKACKNEDAYLLCYIQLIDAESLDIERLFSESYKDSLTYLFNKNALDFHLDKNIGYHYIGFLDLNNFKQINDKYSHHVGNQLLTEIGKKLITVSSDNVIFYRYGGDEFVFITIDLNFEQTIDLANKIQNAVKTIDFYDYKASFSIGISEYSEKAKFPIKDYVNVADYAMYRTKYNDKLKISFIDVEEGNELLANGDLEQALKNLKRS